MKNTYFLLAMLSFIVPVALFGEWNTFTSILFPISIALFGWLIPYKAVEGKEWPTYAYSSLHGFTMTMYGITIFGFRSPDSISMFHLPTYWGIAVYLTSLILFIISARSHRNEKVEEANRILRLTPEEIKAIKRENKINKLLGI